MPLAFDATSNAFGLAVSSLTYSHTCTGSDRLLIVGVTIRDTAGDSPSVSSVTYAGTAMTSVGSRRHASIANWFTQIFRLVAPATGANDVVVTLSESVLDVGSGAVSFTGGHQTDPTGTYASADALAGTPTVTVSSASGEIVVDVVQWNLGVSPSVGAGQTQRWNFNSSGGLFHMGSTEPGAASVVMDWTGGDDVWLTNAVPVKPAPEPAVGYLPGTRMTLTGVGG